MISSVPLIGAVCAFASMTLASSMYTASMGQGGASNNVATEPMSDSTSVALATLALVVCACLNLGAPLLQHDYSLEELSNIFIESNVTATETIEPASLSSQGSQSRRDDAGSRNQRSNTKNTFLKVDM